MWISLVLALPLALEAGFDAGAGYVPDAAFEPRAAYEPALGFRAVAAYEPQAGYVPDAAFEPRAAYVGPDRLDRRAVLFDLLVPPKGERVTPVETAEAAEIVRALLALPAAEGPARVDGPAGESLRAATLARRALVRLRQLALRAGPKGEAARRDLARLNAPPARPRGPDPERIGRLAVSGADPCRRAESSPSSSSSSASRRPDVPPPPNRPRVRRTSS